MAFTPSMSQEEISALDYSRTFGNTSPSLNPVNSARKEPWNVPTPSNPEWNIAGQYEREVNKEEEEEESNLVAKSMTSLRNWLKSKEGI